MLLGLLLPPLSTAALQLEIDNQSGIPDSQVYVTVAGSEFDVENAADDVPQTAEEISKHPLKINKIVSGRIYVSYRAGVENSVDPVTSPTRYDWVELNYHPVDADVVNLTAVDQFGIGMRLDTYNESGGHLEGLGAANSNTIFDALQAIPGGPQATIRNGEGIVRVLSPNKSSVYPDLGDYVRSMAGQRITLHSDFFKTGEEITSVYSGVFAADGSITLEGSTKSIPAVLPSPPPSTVYVNGPELIDDIYDGGGTEANDFLSAMRRDLLAGFSTGLWGGKYGNDAIAFCPTPSTHPELWDWCPHFDEPAFGDARPALSSFPTCEQYAAVINQYSDSYGNPYSDASKRVTVPVVKSEARSGSQPVAKLRLTIQPDEGDAQPETGGNSNCGAAAPPSPRPAAGGAAGGATASTPKSAIGVHVKLFKKAFVKRGRARVGRLACSGPCGRVWLVAKRGKTKRGREKTVGRGGGLVKGRKGVLTLRLDKAGKRLLARRRRARAKLRLQVTPAGGQTVRRGRATLLVAKRSR